MININYDIRLSYSSGDHISSHKSFFCYYISPRNWCPACILKHNWRGVEVRSLRQWGQGAVAGPASSLPMIFQKPFLF